VAALVLLLASVAINYCDRGNLSVAAPLLNTELGISTAQLGILFSAFFWTYALFQLVAGWLVDRFDAGWVLAAGFAAWSLATAGIGWAGGFASLFALRLLIGVGESVAYPSYSKFFARYYDEKQRGIANSLIDVGNKSGLILGTLFGGLITARYGWRPLFWILGFGALLWLPLWIRWMPRQAGGAPITVDRGPRVRDILRQRSAWATFLGLFCCNYQWYFLLSWLPYYLVRERHFSMREMAAVGALPFGFSAVATIAAGWLSYRALSAGATPNRVRKTCMATGLGLETVIVAVPAVPNDPMAMAILMLASVGVGIYSSSHWSITQTLAGPAASGRWTGVQNFVGNLAGVTAPAITGFVVARTGHFFWAFASAGAVSLSGAMIYLFLLERVEPIVW